MKNIFTLTLLLFSIGVFAQRPKNIIVVVGSGMGYNHIEGTKPENGTCRYQDFPHQCAVYTLPVIGQKITEDKKLDNYNSHYHSAQAWTDLEFIDSSAIDFASAGTALATGYATGTGAVGVGIDSAELASVLEDVKSAGKYFGIVTDVALAQSIAVPFFSKTTDVANTDTIVKQFLTAGVDLMFCSGNPAIDENGDELADPDYSNWASISNWDAIKAAAGVFTEVDSSAFLQNIDLTTSSYYGVFNQGSIHNLQNAVVPALSSLSTNTDGFTLLLESRQIELASKQANEDKLMKTMADFNNAIDSIIDWVENNSSWEETAVIVVGAYETGLVADASFDPESFYPQDLQGTTSVDSIYPFSINSDQNTNLLTPFYAKGAGSEMIVDYLDHSDFYKDYYASTAEVGKLIKRLHTPVEVEKPKNIILMIGDGAGENHLKAAEYYYGLDPAYRQFPVQYFMSTYPGRKDDKKSLGNYAISYSSDRAWGSRDFLFGYNNVTCSASSAIAMGSGKKSYYYGMGLDLEFNALNTIAQHAKKINKSAGVITTMTFYNATPAAFAAHHVSRKTYSAICKEMLIESELDVIIGCGHPEYDNNAELKDSATYGTYGGADVWSALESGETILPTKSLAGWDEVQDVDRDGTPDPWTLVENTDDFKNISAGTDVKRLLGIPKVNETLQQKRDGNVDAVDPASYNDLPTLSDLAIAGLNVLGKNDNGFFAMIEGGAIDQAGHKNQKGRLVEESKDFIDAIDTVIAWIENNGGWEANLLVVTADHETGLLTRESLNNDSIWQKYSISSNGVGSLPEMVFNHKDHSNQLVPFFAKGAGSDIFSHFADEEDYYRGSYITNTEIGEAFHILWDGQPGTIKNYKPITVANIEAQYATVGEEFSFQIPQYPFEDSDDDGDFSFDVVIPNDMQWINFDKANGVVSGVPDAVKNKSLIVTAYDGSGTGAACSVTTRLKINVLQGSGIGSESVEAVAYPNPAESGKVIYLNVKEEVLDVTLMSIDGEFLPVKYENAQRKGIILDGLATGEYVLLIKTAENVHSQPLIIQ